MISKTDKMKELAGSGEWQKALSILRTFRLGFTSDEKRLIQIASDTLNGHGQFYEAIGVDVGRVVADCKQMIKTKYHLAD